MKAYRIAVIPGDGIGVDTIEEALATLEVLCQVHGGLSFSLRSFSLGLHLLSASTAR